MKNTSLDNYIMSDIFRYKCGCVSMTGMNEDLMCDICYDSLYTEDIEGCLDCGREECSCDEGCSICGFVACVCYNDYVSCSRCYYNYYAYDSNYIIGIPYCWSCFQMIKDILDEFNIDLSNIENISSIYLQIIKSFNDEKYKSLDDFKLALSGVRNMELLMREVNTMTILPPDMIREIVCNIIRPNNEKNSI